MSNMVFLKKNNMLDVIKIIKNYSPIAKSDIVKMTGLTATTVNKFISELLAKNIVAEEGIATSNGGRRALLYSFNQKKFFIIGLVISIKSISIGILDLDMIFIDKHEEDYQLGKHSVEEGMEYILQLIQSLIDKNEIDISTIAGIGISVPGPVDYKRGVIYELTNINNWRNVPIKSIVEKRFNVQTIVDKDNSCSATCLKWNESYKDTENMVYFSTIEGIGAGIIINGNIYRGNHSLAGEIGHLSINKTGGKCNCGDIGCFELYASNMGIVHEVKEKLKQGEKSLLHTLCNGNLEEVNIEMIVDAAKNEDLLAKNTLLNASEYISICIRNVIKTYDPDIIVFDSIWMKEFGDIYHSMINSVFGGIEFINRDDIRIEMNTIKDLSIKGAATLIVEELFSADNHISFFVKIAT